MPRTGTRQRFGSYKAYRNGVFQGTFQTQSYYETITRSDIVRRTKDPVTGWRDPTSYSMSYIREEGPRGAYTTKSGSRADRREGYLFGLTTGSSVPIGWDVPEPPTWWMNACIIDALNKLSSGSPSLALALGERQETADMIGDSLTALYRGYRSARRGRWKEAFRHLGYNPKKGWDKNLSSKVLAFNLGVKPFVSDINSSVDKLSEKENSHGVGIIKVVGSRRSGDMSARRLVIDATPSYVPRKILYSEYMETKVRLHWELTNEPMASAEDMGFANPASLAWELLPLSFVLDYVVPIGDYLSALTASLGYTYKGGDSVQWRQCKSVYTSHRVSEDYFSDWLTGSREVRKMSRAQILTPPVPSFPSLKSPVNANKALNVLSLFSQFRR